MPANPNVLERLVLFRLDGSPAPTLDLFGATSFESVTLALDAGTVETLARADGRFPGRRPSRRRENSSADTR